MTNETTTKLAFRLRTIRERKGLTQEQVAEKLGVEIGTLSGYERGYRRPDADKIVQLSKIYNVSSDYILGITSDPLEITGFLSKRVIQYAETMPKNEDEKAALADLKTMSEEKQRRLINEEYESLPPEQRQAIDLIIRSLASLNR